MGGDGPKISGQHGAVPVPALPAAVPKQLASGTPPQGPGASLVHVPSLLAAAAAASSAGTDTPALRQLLQFSFEGVMDIFFSTGRHDGSEASTIEVDIDNIETMMDDPTISVAEKIRRLVATAEKYGKGRALWNKVYHRITEHQPSPENTEPSPPEILAETNRQISTMKLALATTGASILGGAVVGGVVAYYKAKDAYLQREKILLILQESRRDSSLTLSQMVDQVDIKIADPEIQKRAHEAGMAAAYKGTLIGLPLGVMAAAIPVIAIRLMVSRGFSPEAIRLAGRIGLAAAPIAAGIGAGIAAYQIEQTPGIEKLGIGDRLYLQGRNLASAGLSFVGGVVGAGAGGVLANTPGVVAGGIAGTAAGSQAGQDLVDAIASNQLAAFNRRLAQAKAETLEEKRDRLAYELVLDANTKGYLTPAMNDDEIRLRKLVKEGRNAQLIRELVVVAEFGTLLTKQKTAESKT